MKKFFKAGAAAALAALCLAVAGPAYAAGAKIYIAITDGSSVAIADPISLDAWGEIKTGNRPMMLVPSKDGGVVFVSIFDEGKVQVIDAAADKVVRDIPVGNEPYAMDLSPDGALLAVGLSDDTGGVSLVDTKEFKVIKRIKTNGAVFEVKFSPDGKKLYAVHSDKPMQVIDTAKMEPAGEIPIGAETYQIAFSAKGDKLYVNSVGEGTVTVIDLKTSKALKKIPAGKQGLTLSPDGRELWFGGPDNKATVYSLAEDKVLATLPRDVDTDLFIMKFLPDGKTVMAAPAGPENRKVYLYDAVKKEKKGEIVLNGFPRGLAYIEK